MIDRTPMVRRQLPAPSLPAGETLLWQGAPPGGRSPAAPSISARSRSISAYDRVAHRRLPADGAVGLNALGRGLLGPAARLGACRLCCAGWARTIGYTITSRRIVMRIGIALPMALNIPFAIWQRRPEDPCRRQRRHPAGADRQRASPSCSVAPCAAVADAQARADPALPDAAQVAAILAPALTAANGANAATVADPPAGEAPRRPPATAA